MRIGGKARFLMAAALALASATGIRAQTYSGDWALNPACGGNYTGTFTAGCLSEDLAMGGQCSACGVLAAEDEASWSRTAARGSLVGMAHVVGMQYTASPCGTASGGLAQIDQAVTANDVVFTRISDPNAAGLVAVSLNVEFRGHVEALPACVHEYAQVDICTRVVGLSCSTGGSLRVSGSTGVMTTYPNDMSTLYLTGASRNATLGAATTVTLDLRIKTGDTQCESATPRPSGSSATGELTLPTSGPVFVLPPDVTVNSAQLGIVNNQWVGAAPVVTGPPEPQSVCAAGRADFSVVATGAPGPQYQWRRDGQDLADGPTGTGSTIAGATSPTLTVFDVSGADEGSYDCVVSNGCLGTASAAAGLELAPAVADAGPDGSRNEMDSVTLDGSGSEGPGCAPPSATWAQIAGTPVSLDLTDPLRPAFVAPEVGPGGEILAFRLDVSDGAGGAVSDTVALTIVNVTGDVDGDSIQDLVDCAPFDPGAFAIPGQVGGSSFAADGATLSWASAAPAAGTGTTYDVMRGGLKDLPVGGSLLEICLAPATPDLQATDVSVPAPGGGFYYLVRPRNACGVGSYGAASGGAGRISSACP